MTALLFHHQNQASLALGSAAAGSTYDWYPSVDKTVVPRAGPTPTVTRAGATATNYDASGVMQTASANTPRFDHNPSTLASLGLLVEEGVSNECLYSEDFSSWTDWSGGVTLTSNSGTDPKGTTTADKLERVDNTLDGKYVTLTLTANSDYAVSLHVENAGATKTAIAIYDNVAASWIAFKNFDWTDDVPAVGSTQLGSVNDAGVDAGKDGRYRIWFTCNTHATNTSYNVYVVPDNIASGTNGVYAWGAQVEPLAHITSYIGPTTTSAVARNADVVTGSDVSFLDSADTEVGTLFVKCSSPINGKGRRVWQIDDGSDNNRAVIQHTALDKVALRIVDNGVQTGLSQTDDAYGQAGESFLAAGSYEDNNVVIAVDGTLATAGTFTLFPLTGTMTTFRIGSDNSPKYYNGHIQRVIYWPEAKDDATIRALTTGPETVAVGTMGCNIPMLAAAGIL